MKMEPNLGPILFESLEELRGSTELSSVQLSIQRMEKREQDTKKALADIELQLQLLRDREISYSRKLERRRARRLALASCCSRLTDETLLKILLCVVSENPTSSQRTFLRLVCKKWNRFFDTTPSLWQKIHITIPSKLKHTFGCHKYCGTAMEKSGKANLDVLIDYGGIPEVWDILEDLLGADSDGLFRFRRYDDDDESVHCCYLEERILEPYFEVMTHLQGLEEEFSGRWRSAEVKIGDSYSFPRILSSMKPFPNLESLKITGEWAQATLFNEDAACLVQLEETFPKLRYLSLSHLKWGPSVEGAFSTSLMFLSVSDCSSLIFNWIPHCRSLIHLHLAHLDNDKTAFQFESSTSTLPVLKTLFLAGRIPKGFWNAFDFPSLESMEVGSEEIEMIGLDISKIFKPVKEEIVRAPLCDWKEYRVLDLRSSSGLGGAEVMRKYLTE